MTAADNSTKQASRPVGAIWRDPVWLGVIALIVIISATIVGAIAGRALDAIDPWALAISGVSIAIGAIASLAILSWRQQTAAAAGTSIGRLVEALPHASVVVDGNGRAAAANNAFLSLFPGSDHAPLAAFKAAMADGDHADSIIASLADAIGTGQTVNRTMEVMGGGEAQWLSVTAAPLADGSGLALWTFENVSARQAEMVAVREGSALLREAADTVPVGLFAAEEDGRLTLVNAILASWLGYEPGAIEDQGLSAHELLIEPAADLPAYRVSGAAGPDESERKVIFRTNDGGALPLSVVQSEPGEAGAIRNCAVVRRIASEAKSQVRTQSKPAALRSEHRFEQVFANAPVAVALLGAEGRIDEANRAWLDLLAPGESDVGGRPLVELVSDDESENVAAWLQRLANDPAGALRQDVKLRTTTDAGTDRIATMYASALDANGGAGQLIVHAYEATDQRQLEEQFVQGQKMQAVGQLAGGVAHDFNNLLTAMIGFCDLLLLRHSPGDQSFGDIMQIKQNANRAARLVRQLLAFSRQQTLQPRVLSITDVLGDLTNLLRRLIGASINLSITHGRDLGMVRVDQGQLEQVVINLAVNARDAMRDGGALNISTHNDTIAAETRRGSEVILPGDYVAIEIADNGSGIEPEIMERIFEPFFTTKEVGAGTGLGLSTVYGIVKQTGGQIFVDSTVGKGTTFTILIPQHEVSAEEEARKSETADGPAAAETTGAGTVLLVEDEDAVRLFSARALRAKGYNVLEAHTGEAALELVAEVDDHIDLMITDAVMPEMDGPTLILKMREDRPDLRIICISGYAEETFREKLGESDDIHFLPKPFSLNQLAGKVKDVMSLPGD